MMSGIDFTVDAPVARAAQLEREAEAIARCAVEEHAGEGISAFLERRMAKFS